MSTVNYTKKPKGVVDHYIITGFRFETWVKSILQN